MPDKRLTCGEYEKYGRRVSSEFEEHYDTEERRLCPAYM